MIYALLAVMVPVFASLTLATAQQQGVAHAPAVAIARAKVAEARADFDLARSAYAPSLVGNYSLAPQGIGVRQTYEQHLTTVGAQVMLGDLLAAAPQIAQAHAQLRSAQFGLADVERTERIGVIAAFYGDLDARATVDARSAALADARSQRRAARLRFGAGDAPRLDVVRADVAVAQAEADLARANADRANADAALAQETGVEATSLDTQERDQALPPMLPYDINACVHAALASRPELAAAQADVQAEEHAVAVARRGGFPALTVQGGYTRGADSGITVAGPSANVTMSVPLGGAARDRVDAEGARLTQARLAQEQVRRKITLEVGNAVRTLDAQGRALAAAVRAANEAQTEFDATRIGYRNGASSSLDVESARSTYVAAVVAEISAYYAQAQALATLQLLMGTGHA